jgi:DNA-binding FadR family transcriptional regulator
MNIINWIFKGSDPMAANLPSELLCYLARQAYPPRTRLPAIQELSTTLGISTGKLREQLEVARQLGLVEVRPKTGIRTLDFSFFQMIKIGLSYALAMDPKYFFQFGILRNNVEAAFWHEAVGLLLPKDKDHLMDLMERAWTKLRGYPIQIPHDEHRDLHLTIYSRLENPFVVGLLEAYWEAYETVGLNLYADYSYLESVWNYHDQMVKAILSGDIETGYRALVEHTGLIHNRPEIGRFRPPEVENAIGWNQ